MTNWPRFESEAPPPPVEELDYEEYADDLIQDGTEPVPMEITVERILAELSKIGFSKAGGGRESTSKLKALELLGKYLAMFIDKKEISGPGGEPLMPHRQLDLSNLTPEEQELGERFLKILEKARVEE